MAPGPASITALAAALSLGVLALDVAAATAPARASAAARAALGATCHQRPERSLRLGQRPLGACARCVGVHAGGLAAFLLVSVAGAQGVRRHSRRWACAALVAALVLGADVIAGAAFRWDHAWLRALTGVLAAGLATTWAIGRVAAGLPASQREAPPLPSMAP